MTICNDGLPKRRYVAIAEDLLLGIRSNLYPSGTRLPSHSEIASSYEVSRPIAREALLALELAGAVQVRHGDGTFVAEQAVRALPRSNLEAPPHELIETRLLIEPLCAGLAAERIGRDQVVELERLLDAQEALLDEPSELARFVEIGLQFHAELAPACRNYVLASITRELVDGETHPLWSLINQQGLPDRHSRQQQIIEHRAILVAVRVGDPAAAASAMRSHLEILSEAMFGRQAQERPAGRVA